MKRDEKRSKNVNQNQKETQKAKLNGHKMIKWKKPEPETTTENTIIFWCEREKSKEKKQEGNSRMNGWNPLQKRSSKNKQGKLFFL